jgi:hypothetical protein
MEESWQNGVYGMPGVVRRVIIVVLAFPLAAFFAFVGWHKTFASLEDLLRYGAWTAHVPMWLGRAVGLSELISVIALLASPLPRFWRWTALAALYLAATQVVSTIVHIRHGELASLPNNAVLAISLLLAAWLARPVKPE